MALLAMAHNIKHIKCLHKLNVTLTIMSLKIPHVEPVCSKKGLNLPISEITFFLGRETIIPSKTPGMALWREHLFALMSRNSQRATAYFGLPPDQVIEVGIQVEI